MIDNRQMEANVITLARWMARKAIRTELRAKGLRPECIETRTLAVAATVYFDAYREELIEEARNHPALLNKS
jgi:hypothetical protein